MKSIVAVVFRYDRGGKKVETEIFIHSINEKQLCWKLTLRHLLMI